MYMVNFVLCALWFLLSHKGSPFLWRAHWMHHLCSISMKLNFLSRFHFDSIYMLKLFLLIVVRYASYQYAVHRHNILIKIHNKNTIFDCIQCSTIGKSSLFANHFAIYVCNTKDKWKHSIKTNPILFSVWYNFNSPIDTKVIIFSLSV